MSHKFDSNLQGADELIDADTRYMAIDPGMYIYFMEGYSSFPIVI